MSMNVENIRLSHTVLKTFILGTKKRRKKKKKKKEDFCSPCSILEPPLPPEKYHSSFPTVVSKANFNLASGKEVLVVGMTVCVLVSHFPNSPVEKFSKLIILN